jgi:hypothetical protein
MPPAALSCPLGPQALRGHLISYIMHYFWPGPSKTSTRSIQNIKNTFLILRCTSSPLLLPPEQPQFHMDSGPCRLQYFPQLCQVGWMSFGWWNILDTHRKMLSMKNPAPLQFLTQTSAPGIYYHTPFKKALKIFCLSHSPPEWNTNTIHFSIVYLTRLLPFIYT